METGITRNPSLANVNANHPPAVRLLSFQNITSWVWHLPRERSTAQSLSSLLALPVHTEGFLDSSRTQQRPPRPDPVSPGKPPIGMWRLRRFLCNKAPRDNGFRPQCNSS